MNIVIKVYRTQNATEFHYIHLHIKYTKEEKKEYETGTQFSLCSECVCVLRIFCWRCVGIWINFLFHWYRAWHARIMQVKVYPLPLHRGKKSKERDEVRLAFWIEIWYKPYADKHQVCEKRTTSVKRNKNLHFIYDACMCMRMYICIHIDVEYIDTIVFYIWA